MAIYLKQQNGQYERLDRTDEQIAEIAQSAIHRNIPRTTGPVLYNCSDSKIFTESHVGDVIDLGAEGEYEHSNQICLSYRYLLILSVNKADCYSGPGINKQEYLVVTPYQYNSIYELRYDTKKHGILTFISADSSQKVTDFVSCLEFNQDSLTAQGGNLPLAKSLTTNSKASNFCFNIWNGGLLSQTSILGSMSQTIILSDSFPDNITSFDADYLKTYGASISSQLPFFQYNPGGFFYYTDTSSELSLCLAENCKMNDIIFVAYITQAGSTGNICDIYGMIPFTNSPDGVSDEICSSYQFPCYLTIVPK